MDASRFGDWAGRGYANAKVRENYSRRFQIRFPNEELPAARTAAHHADLRPPEERESAVFGDSLGAGACALVRAGRRTEPVETVTFRRSNAHGPVAGECRAVREAVGMIEIVQLRQIRGDGTLQAEAWLAHASSPTACRPKGRIVLVADAQSERQADRRFHGGQEPGRSGSTSSAPALPRPITCAGLPPICRTGAFRHPPAGDWSSSASPLPGRKARDLHEPPDGRRPVGRSRSRSLPFRELELGLIPAKVGRISFTGDLGYEIWVRCDYQIALYDAHPRGRCRSWPEAVRCTRAQRAAAGEEFRHLGAGIPADLRAG